MAKEKVDKKQADKNFFIFIGVIILLVLALVTNGFGLFDRSSTNSGSGEYIPLEIGQAPTLGSPDAPVVIYEFSDFSCPFCGAAAGFNQPAIDSLASRVPNYEPAIPKIKEEYIDSGQVLLVWKYFPGHGTGQQAQRVGYCLNDQDLFWEFHDLAFQDTGNLNNLNAMRSLAEQVGADLDLVNNCLSSGKYDSLLEADTLMGRSNGISGTPGFFINGIPVNGAQSFNAFKQIIDSELAKFS